MVISYFKTNFVVIAFTAFTDDRFDHLKVLSSDSIMKMSKTPSKNTLIGQKTRFLCYYSEFFIANGIVWSLEMKNGSMTYFDQAGKNIIQKLIIIFLNLYFD